MPATYYDVEIAISNGTDYLNRIRPKTVVANITDLLSGGKIDLKWFPSAALGASTSAGSISTAQNTATLLGTLDTWLTNMGYPMATDAEKKAARGGKYFYIFASSVILTCSVDHEIHYSEQTGTVEPAGTVTLEAGDRIQYSHFNDGLGVHVWGIINNQYADATESEKGVVKLATLAEVTTGTDTVKAVTPAGAKKAAQDHHPNGAITSGTYTKVTVDSRGHIGAGSNPTTLAGYGITDAAPLTHVGTRGAAHTVATTGEAGFMSSADKTKLDGIAAGANAYVHPAYTADTETTTGVEVMQTVTSDATGHVTAISKRTLPNATTSAAGVMSSADKTKLDGIAANANNYSHPTQTAISLDATTIETIDTLSVNDLGHVTAATKQTIRSATESQTGVVELADTAEAKAGTDTAKALSAQRVRDLLGVWATIATGTVLPDMSTEAAKALNPSGRLFLLQV